MPSADFEGSSISHTSHTTVPVTATSIIFTNIGYNAYAVTPEGSSQLHSPVDKFAYIFSLVTGCKISSHSDLHKHDGFNLKTTAFVTFNTDVAVKGKGSPYLITERRVPELIPVLGSQPAGDMSHKPGGRLPLLSARPAVTLATHKRAATNFAAW